MHARWAVYLLETIFLYKAVCDDNNLGIITNGYGKAIYERSKGGRFISLCHIYDAVSEPEKVQARGVFRFIEVT